MEPMVFNSLDQKQCSRCREWKFPEEFNKEKKTLCGLTSACKECYKIINSEAKKRSKEILGEENFQARKRSYSREAYKRNPDKIKAQSRKTG